MNLGFPVNTEYREITATISGDGRTLIFASNRPETIGHTGDPSDAPDLWMSTRAANSESSPWSDPVNLGRTVNSSTWDAYPLLSADGLVLYFTSSRQDGFNNLYMTKRPSIGEPFGPPVLLSPFFTRFSHAADPAFSPDGQTLYFVTRGLRTSPSDVPSLWQARALPNPALSISTTTAGQ